MVSRDMPKYRQLEKRLISLKGKLKKLSIQKKILHGQTFYSLKYGSSRKKIFVSAGIHGDEPAGVYAILDFLKNHAHKYPGYEFDVFPCLNPWGFDKKIRYNQDGHDLNRILDKNNFLAMMLTSHLKRGIRYELAINLHEDNSNMAAEGFLAAESPKNFYLYIMKNHKIAESGKKIIYEVKKKGYGVCMKNRIYGDKNRGGVVLDKPKKGEFEYLLKRYASNIFVPETPTCWGMNRRVGAHLEAMRSLIEEFS